MSDVVEQYTIRPIPGSARHGNARDLLPFWFTVNASVYTIGLGVFAAEFRLGLWPTIAAIVAGATVGGAFMAAHSAQGPRLGVPQLVQSRAQFGFYGALLPNAAIWLLLLSTLVAADVTAGGTLAGLWHISSSSRRAFWHTNLGSVAGAAIFASIGEMASTITLRTTRVSPVGYLSTLLPGSRGWP